ncbi:MAG: hypothetical protein ACK5GU_02130 [Chloroflexota bacterium]
MTPTNPPPSQPNMTVTVWWRKPEFSAWVTLIVAFGFFVIIAVVTLQLAWQAYTSAMRTQEGAMLRSHVAVGVLLQEPRSVTSRAIERLPENVDPCPGESDICIPLRSGDRVRTVPAAGYGPVASLVLPDTTHIQLWAQDEGSDLVYHTYQVSRWNNQRQIVSLQQHSGYARYDVAQFQPYQKVEYNVVLPDGVIVWMTPGGSYSVHIYAKNRQNHYEIAVRSGSATVQHASKTVSLASGELVAVDHNSVIADPVDASWQLIRDPDWQDISSEDSGTTTVGGWNEFRRAEAPNMRVDELNGRLSVVQGCSPESPDLCSADEQVRVLRLRRDGSQTRPFAVGVEQDLDADVSEYTSLRLTAWVRVLTQSVPVDGGIAGSECPVMFTLVYKYISPADEQLERNFCLYAYKSTDMLVTDTGRIRYRALPPFEWYRLDVDLREDEYLRLARYLQSVRIEARGNDYMAEITDLALIGRQ